MRAAAIIICLLICSLVLCGFIHQEHSSSSIEIETEAREVLIQFYKLLNLGEYLKAQELYGGSYQILRDWYPDVGADDFTELWHRGCWGFQCLQIREVVSQVKLDGYGYRFVVKFSTDKGELYVVAPCCDAPAEAPRESLFTQEVHNIESRWQVVGYPPYEP